jgi:hypothetical protein
VIVFQNSIILSLSISAGTVSSDYGRVSNMPNDRIHVAAAMTIPDCIRLCVDFSKTYLEYVYEDCFAYNYEIDTFTCELIHSEQPANYIVGFQTRWITGLKN